MIWIYEDWGVLQLSCRVLGLRLRCVRLFKHHKRHYVVSSRVALCCVQTGFGLSVRHNFVSAQYLEKNLIEFDKILYVHWYWQHLDLDRFSSFSHNCTRVMALDWCQHFVQNFVLAQYLENVHLYWQDLGCDCYLSFFANMNRFVIPWLMSDIRFLSITRTSWYKMM